LWINYPRAGAADISPQVLISGEFMDRKQYQSQWNRNNYFANREAKLAAAKVYYRKIWGKHLAKLGWTVAEYEAAEKEQTGLCSICWQKPKGTKLHPERRLDADHNHATGRRRQLLCQACNKALGLFEDSIERVESALRYLKFHRVARY
jgi:Recombination endonuclease VII